MAIALYAIGEYSSLAGRFGMTLEQARDCLLAKAEEFGLVPQIQKLKEGKSFWVDFYPRKRPEGVRPPWQELRSLANEFSVPYDHGGDPPWTYRLVVEKPPPEGEYKPV